MQHCLRSRYEHKGKNNLGHPEMKHATLKHRPKTMWDATDQPISARQAGSATFLETTIHASWVGCSSDHRQPTITARDLLARPPNNASSVIDSAEGVRSNFLNYREDGIEISTVGDRIHDDSRVGGQQGEQEPVVADGRELDLQHERQRRERQCRAEYQEEGLALARLDGSLESKNTQGTGGVQGRVVYMLSIGSLSPRNKCPLVSRMRREVVPYGRHQCEP